MHFIVAFQSIRVAQLKAKEFPAIKTATLDLVYSIIEQNEIT